MCNLGWIAVSCDPGNLGFMETGSVWDVRASGSLAARHQDKMHFPQTQRQILEDNPTGGSGCSCNFAGSTFLLLGEHAYKGVRPARRAFLRR